MAREEWTDKRLDDLDKGVDDGFKEMREEFRALRSESKRFAALQRTTVQLFGGMLAMFVIGVIAILLHA